MRRSNMDSRRGLAMLAIVGWGLLVIVGIALLYIGFIRPRRDARQAAEAEPTPASTPLPTLMEMPTMPPATATFTPQPPTNTPVPPTAVPPTPTSAVPKIVAGPDGVNVRTGSSTAYTRIGYLDPNTEARVTGQHNGWWQIDYNGAAGWVYGDIVTAQNTDSVPEVQPPPAPTAVPPTATPQPTAKPEPTNTPGPVTHGGILAHSFSVEGAPGPYGTKSTGDGCDDSNGSIWYNMHVQNVSGNTIDYTRLGAFVQEKGYHKPSWTDQSLDASEDLEWRDCFHIDSAGTYNIYLRICLNPGGCANIAGPIQVQVQ